jgi:hypothetical protein
MTEQEVNAVHTLTAPTRLRWSQTAITFDQEDHPDCVPHPGRYPLVVSPIVGTTRLTKVLMGRGSGLNILYATTLDKMGIPRSSLCPSKALFYGIVLGKEAAPLGRIRLNVTFGQPDNFRKEPLGFEVVNFSGVYHALLGQSCFAKFIAIPNYTYLKLKMTSPKGVITVEGSFEQAYYCEQDCIAQEAALIAPCAPNGPGCDTRRAPTKEAAKAVAVLGQPGIGEVAKVPGGSDGSAGPLHLGARPPEGVDLIEVSSDLSP